MTTVKEFEEGLFYYYVQGVLKAADDLGLPPKNTLKLIKERMKEIESMKDEVNE